MDYPFLIAQLNHPTPPCTDREYGIQLFLQLGSALAAQTPTISVRDFETSNGEMPWYPGGGADFLNDYATRSTTASGRSAKGQSGLAGEVSTRLDDGWLLRRAQSAPVAVKGHW